MREIKFRAWNYTTNPPTMVYFGLKNVPTVLWDTIMEYTGLKDKNGNEIYEGDIVRYESHYIGDSFVPANKDKVIYENGYFCIDCDYAPYLCVEEVKNCGIEIIGNVYENPELIS